MTSITELSVSTELRIKELLRERRWTTKVLAEKTGMSESYLTHIKNGTRRWNEDALKKLSKAFDLSPIDFFSERRGRTDSVEFLVDMPKEASLNTSVQVVPIMSKIPSDPSPYNNQLMQEATGFKDKFVPIFGSTDPSMFCLQLDDASMAPYFMSGDFIIISPEVWTRSGDIAAVEFGNDELKRHIMKITYMDEFIVLDSVNHGSPPVALVRGKDNFRVIGKAVCRYQNYE